MTNTTVAVTLHSDVGTVQEMFTFLTLYLHFCPQQLLLVHFSTTGAHDSAEHAHSHSCCQRGSPRPESCPAPVVGPRWWWKFKVRYRRTCLQQKSLHSSTGIVAVLTLISRVRVKKEKGGSMYAHRPAGCEKSPPHRETTTEQICTGRSGRPFSSKYTSLQTSETVRYGKEWVSWPPHACCVSSVRRLMKMMTYYHTSQACQHMTHMGQYVLWMVKPNIFVSKEYHVKQVFTLISVISLQMCKERNTDFVNDFNEKRKYQDQESKTNHVFWLVLVLFCFFKHFQMLPAWHFFVLHEQLLQYIQDSQCLYSLFVLLLTRLCMLFLFDVLNLPALKRCKCFVEFAYSMTFIPFSVPPF